MQKLCGLRMLCVSMVASGVLALGSGVVTRAQTSTWATPIPSGNIFCSAAMTSDKLGNTFTSGFTESTPQSNGVYFMTAVFNSAGNYMVYRYPGKPAGFPAQGMAIAADGNGNAASVAFTYGGADPRYTHEIALVFGFNAKQTSNFSPAWSNTFDAGVTTTPYAVVMDTSGSVYLTGAAGGSIFVVKYNSSGSLAWPNLTNGAVTWADSQNSGDAGIGLALDGSGNLYVSGKIGSSTSSGELLKISCATGQLTNAVSTTVGSSQCIVAANNAIYIATGGVGYVLNPATGAVTATSSAGTIAQIAVDSSGEVFAINHGVSQLTNTSIVTTRLNPATLATLWQDTYSISGTTTTYGRGISADNIGHVYVAGQDQNSVVVLKYNATQPNSMTTVNKPVSPSPFVSASYYSSVNNSGPQCAGLGTDGAGDIFTVGNMPQPQNSSDTTTYTLGLGLIGF